MLEYEAIENEKSPNPIEFRGKIQLREITQLHQTFVEWWNFYPKNDENKQFVVENNWIRYAFFTAMQEKIQFDSENETKHKIAIHLGNTSSSVAIL